MESIIQKKLRKFEAGITPFQKYVSEAGGKSLSELNDLFHDGLRGLGVGELYARQHERASQLPSLGALAKESRNHFQKNNDRGIGRIAAAMAKIKEVEKDFADITKERIAGIGNLLKDAVDEFKQESVNLEIKGKDVTTLFTSIDDIVATAQAKGAEGVLSVINKKMRELTDVRKSDNRGAVDNFPVWKIAAIVIAIGIWVLALIRCGIFGCSIVEGAAYFIIFWIAAIVARFC